MKQNVIVYSASWCAFCHAAMGYLDKLGVKYVEEDVEKDAAAAKAAIEKSGQMGVPVIDVDGKIILGFDKQKLDLALKQAQLV
jgi:glutaredoxin 3